MENWAKIEEIVSAALALNGEERKSFVNDQCRKFPELKEEIVSLLRSENDADDFFDSPAALQYASLITEENSDAKIGELIGNYQIVREIGTGGMGAVYLATRVDGNLEQKVAIKMLRREFNTQEIRQRFEYEKEIQSALNHQNIAHLIDAGTTKDSVPFLVLEYIEGENISEYCQREDLSLKERLKLFNKVCDAVAFAHRNLVIHRDLKPSNIIVTKDGEPKLLDFGISKLLDENVDQTQTITKMGVMTPEYASPEQTKGESVTTATDIYSLGVILFELLTGHQPFEKEFQSSGNIFKVILENEPKKPSDILTENTVFEIENEKTLDHQRKQNKSIDEAKTKLVEKKNTQEVSGQTKSQFAITNPKYLRGDLDNIILKALRKEPERRYQTVAQFSEDIWRHLDGMPVSARPATFHYRASKFVKRNKVGVFASSLILLAIIGGLFATLWQARRAEAQKVKAEKRFNDVRSLANSILFDVYPSVESLEGSIEARKKIVDNSIKYLDSLSKEAVENTELQLDLAKAYMKIGDVQGNNKYPNLGDLKGSLESYQKAGNLINSVFLKDRNNDELKDTLARVLENEAFVLWWMGDNKKTYRKFDEAIKLRKELIENNPDSDKYKFALADLYLYYGDVPFWENKIDQAKEIYEYANADLYELLENDPNDPNIKARYSYSLNRLSKIDVNLGDFKKGIERLEEAEEIAQKIVDENPKVNKFKENLWGMQFSICELYIVRKDTQNAVDKCPRIVETQRKFVMLEPANSTAKYNLSISYSYLGRAYRMANRYKSAVETINKSVEYMDLVLEENPQNIGYRQERIIAIHSTGALYRKQGDLKAAQKVYESTIEEYKKLLKDVPNEPRSTLNLFKSYADLANILLSQKNTKSAILSYRKSYSLGQKLLSENALSDDDKKTLKKVEATINKIGS